MLLSLRCELTTFDLRNFRIFSEGKQTHHQAVKRVSKYNGHRVMHTRLTRFDIVGVECKHIRLILKKINDNFDDTWPANSHFISRISFPVLSSEGFPGIHWKSRTIRSEYATAISQGPSSRAFKWDKTNIPPSKTRASLALQAICWLHTSERLASLFPIFDVASKMQHCESAQSATTEG